MPKRGLALGVGVAWFWVGRAGATAQEPPLPLEGIAVRYRVPDGEDCPNDQWFIDQVRARVHYDPFGVPERHELEVEIERQDRRLVCLVTLRRANGKLEGTQRLVTAHEDCAGLASAAVLAASIAILPLTAADDSFSGKFADKETPKPAPDGPTETETTARAEVLAARPASHRAQSWPLVEAGMAVGGIVGAQPTAALSNTLLVGVRWSKFLLGLEVFGALPLNNALSEGVSTHEEGATIQPCWTPSRWSVCGLLSIAVLGASAAVPSGLSSGSALHVAAGARVAWETGSPNVVRVRLEGDLWVPVVRGEVWWEKGLLWRAPLIASGLSAALLVPLRF